MSYILWLLSGAIAGWLAGKIMKSNSGLVTNILLGLAGGVIGSVLFGIIGLGAKNIIGGIIVSAVGACVLIWLVRMIKK